MTIAESKQTAVILIDCQDSVGDDAYFNTAAPQNNVLVFNCSTKDYIEPLLSALRAHYVKFNAVSFVTNNAGIHTELTRFFPELFRGIRFIEQLPLPLTKTDMTELMSVAMTLSPFELVPAEPLVSTEFNQLKNFFLLDERLTDIAEHESISQLTAAFIAGLQDQKCAFSVYTQIRLLNFYANRLNKYGEVYFKSLSLKLGDTNVSILHLWQLVSDSRFTLNQRYFIYNQLLSLEFSGTLKNKSDFNTRFTAYSHVVREFALQLGLPGAFIDKEERNPDIVFVFIAQFLSPRHAPSKIVLEIIKALCLSANKQVVLIDTCELLPTSGALLWYDAAYGSRGEYNAETLTYEGARFNYLQLSAGMPNLVEINGVIELIKTYKPYFTITVGESITADIISQLVPNVVVPTVSRLPHTLSQYRVFNKRFITSADEVPECLQQGILSVDMLPERALAQSELTRDQFGIPRDKVVLAVPGNRLDAEIDDNFISMLLCISSDSYFVVFAGVFNDYEDYCNRFPVLRNISVFVGYQEDLPAFIKLVDLYVTPQRVGGGLTALCALSMSVPVLTLKYGDTYSFAGDLFAFNTLHEMGSLISAVCNDLAALDALKSSALQRFVELEALSDKYTDLFDNVVNGPLFNVASVVARSD
jgi:glycosyltransferase involved in cell wall biosynthesis